MNTDDREYLAYLTAWVVDRLVTTIYRASPTSGECELCDYSELLEQAREINNAYLNRGEE